MVCRNYVCKSSIALSLTVKYIDKRIHTPLPSLSSPLTFMRSGKIAEAIDTGHILSSFKIMSFCYSQCVCQSNMVFLYGPFQGGTSVVVPYCYLFLLSVFIRIYRECLS